MPTKPTITSLAQEVTDLKKLVLDKAVKPQDSSITQAELDLIRKENLALKAQLEQLDPGSPAADLAHALKGSLDDLQQTCSAMNNPVSDFAVKEFSLQANVVMRIDGLGQAHYRFLRPGENVDERAVSRLSISLVPLPKQTPQGQLLANGGDLIDIEAIDGIGDANRKLLNQRGIYSIADLLKTSTRVRSRAELSALLGIERQKLSSWLDQAELMAVKDIGEQGAKVLAKSGVTSLGALAQQEPEALDTIVKKKLSAEAAKRLGPLDAQRLKTWIDSAQGTIGTPKPPKTDPPA